MNATQNGGAATRRAPQYFGTTAVQTKVTFDPPHVPVILRPTMVPTRPVPGKFGEQFKWEFEGDLVAWFDPDVHKEICACLEVAGCSEIAITKTVRRGEAPRFEVQPVRDETEGGHPAPPPRSRAEARAQVPATAARRIEEIKAAAPNSNPFNSPRDPASTSTRPRFHHEEAIEAETAPPSSTMAEALMEAMLAIHEVIAIATAHSIAWKPSSEDIRALAITIYIQKCGGRK